MAIIKQTNGLHLATYDNDADLFVTLSSGATKKATADAIMTHHSYCIGTRTAMTTIGSSSWTAIGTGGAIATESQRPNSGTNALRGSGVGGEELVRIEDASLAGTYFVNCRVTIGDPANATGSRLLEITKGTTSSGAKGDHTTFGKISVKAHGTVDVELSCSGMVELALNDTVKAWAYNTTTSRKYGGVRFFVRRVR